MRRAATALLAASLAACTPMQWVKADADAAQAGRDLAECGREAWLRSWDRAFLYDMMPPLVVRDAQGRVYVLRRHSPFGDPYFIEGRLRDQCMRERGYALVPLKEPGAAR